MRLICPNCGAQYEVSADAIPPAGRDVQCSACNHTWFEKPGASLDAEAGLEPAPRSEPVPPEPSPPEPRPEPEPEPEPEGIPDPGPASDVPRPDLARPSLSPEVAAILQAERAREEAARKAETIESQPDLGLTEPSRGFDPDQQRADEARRRMARLKGEPAPAAAAAPRRDLLPDIEEINSSLRPDTSTPAATPVRRSRAAADPAEEVARRRGFRYGFATVLFVAAGAALVYVQAPRLAATVPALAPALDRYVEGVDTARLWLDLRLQGLTDRLQRPEDGSPSDAG